MTADPHALEISTTNSGQLVGVCKCRQWTSAPTPVPKERDAPKPDGRVGTTHSHPDKARNTIASEHRAHLRDVAESADA